MSASSCSLGITPASLSRVALTRTMNRMRVSLSGQKGCVLTLRRTSRRGFDNMPDAAPRERLYRAHATADRQLDGLAPELRARHRRAHDLGGRAVGHGGQPHVRRAARVEPLSAAMRRRRGAVFRAAVVVPVARVETPLLSFGAPSQ